MVEAGEWGFEIVGFNDGFVDGMGLRVGIVVIGVVMSICLTEVDSGIGVCLCVMSLYTSFTGPIIKF